MYIDSVKENQKQEGASDETSSIDDDLDDVTFPELVWQSSSGDEFEIDDSNLDPDHDEFDEVLHVTQIGQDKKVKEKTKVTLGKDVQENRR